MLDGILGTRVLLFSPSADIWEHSFPEALVGEMLLEKGMDVTAVRCRGVLRPLCPAGQAAGFTANTPVQVQQRLCARCHAKGRLADRVIGLRHIEIDDYAEKGDEALIDKLIQQANVLRPELQLAKDFEQLHIQEHAVGRTALYELILRHKKNDFEFSDEVWREYLIFLRLAARVSLMSKRILRAEKPDRVSAYNSLYVAHRAFCMLARQSGIAQYFMHAGTNLSRQHGTLMIGQDFTWRYLRDLVDRYDEYAKKPVTPAVIDDVTRHFLCLLSSSNSFVYSTARSKEYFDVRAHFGVQPDQRLIVASTSSYDERFAVESVNASPPSADLLFPRILDWITYLIELAMSRPDWCILIRVHPREFPNKRDRVQSEHARRMKDILQDPPSNVKVNWPDDNLSLYDLAQEADLFLNAWSSVGKEMALLGLPVVIYSPDIVLYPTALNNVGKTKDDYVAAIEAALVSGWSFERSRQAYRWYALEFTRSIVDMRTSFAPARRYHRGLFARVILRLLRTLVSLPQERWDLFRRKPMPRAQEVVHQLFAKGLESSERAQKQEWFEDNFADEDSAIRSSLGQLGEHLFAANPLDRPSKLQRAFVAAGIAMEKR
jgi:hypothetical protein